MSPVGVTPLAATLRDLAAVYVTDAESLAALLAQVDTDVDGVRLPTAPATSSAAGTAGDAVARPAALATRRGTQPFGGLLGQAFAAGAAVVGGGAAAQALAPPGVRFDAAGHAYQVLGVSDATGGAEPPAVSTGTDPGAVAGRPRAVPVVERGPGALPGLPALPGRDSGAAADHASGHASPGAYRGTSPAVATDAGRPGGAVGDAAGVSGARPGGSGVPMIGGPAGDHRDGHGHRLPAWLSESEDVWGEELTVTPPLIGAPPDASPLRAPRLL